MRLALVGMLVIALHILPLSARAADVAAGKAKAEICAGCHGENGTRRPRTPLACRLSPISSSSGSWCIFAPAAARTSRCSQSSSSSTTTTSAISAPISLSFDAAQGASKDDDPDLSEKGKQAAAGRRCASCHTDSYAGTKAVARVAGQREDYLLKALHDYKIRRALRRRPEPRWRMSPIP